MPNILIILQGMDTSGKGGVIRHAIGMVDPQGVKIKAFKAPTAEERSHQFLWRITRELPPPGHHRHLRPVPVRGRARRAGQRAGQPKAVWSRRYNSINNWEAKLAASGTVIIKCFLHISPDEQTARLRARLDDPTKHWKYNPGDVDERAKWPAYMDAYADALELCNTEAAPWYVIPSDRKWYRNWAVAQLLVEHLRALNLSWPVADFDVETEKARLSHDQAQLSSGADHGRDGAEVRPRPRPRRPQARDRPAPGPPPRSGPGRPRRSPDPDPSGAETATAPASQRLLGLAADSSRRAPGTSCRRRCGVDPGRAACGSPRRCSDRNRRRTR